MWKTVLRRFLVMIPQLFILSLLVFILASMMPGDPFTGLINPNVDPKTIARMKQELGLNDAPWTQYTRWIVNLFHGDLGQSYIQKVSVVSLVSDRAVNTFWLALLSVVLTYLIAVPMGIAAGRHQDEWQDQAAQIYNYITFAIPGFVFLILGLWLFGFILGWFPISGSVSAKYDPGTIGYIGDRLYHMILPAVLGAVLSTTGTVQYLRTGIIDNKVEDYVRTARAKGVSRVKLIFVHALRNALIPVITYVGPMIAYILTGSMVVENIFTIGGLGSAFVTSITNRDYTTIMATTMFLAILMVIANLLTDIAYKLVDPRITFK